MKIAGFILIFCCTATVALGNVSVPELARSKAWLRLLHYDASSPDESRIDSELFFLSPHGKTDPLSEMMQTIAILEEDTAEIGPYKLRPRCAFPARARFLEDRLHLKFPRPACEGIDRWRREINVGGVSLVFSTAYPGNPASMFGHTFIKFNSKSGNAHFLRDYGASFSAVEEDDNALLYFYKGVSGGYKGYFSLSPYYEKVAEYARFENRDLWEFPLKLNQQESLFLLEHFWELYALANVDYYFFTENCSFILLGTIEAVQPEWDLTRRFIWAVTPHETVLRLQSEGAIAASPNFRPSYRRKYFARYDSLDQQDIDLHTRILAAKIDVGMVRNRAALDLALDYLAYQRALQKDRFSESDKQLEARILAQRASLKGKSAFTVPPANNRPDQAHSPYFLQTAVNDNTLRLGGRYGFHSLAESNTGYEENMQIEYFKMDFMHRKGMKGMALDALTIADIMALGRCQSIECPHSWRVMVNRDLSLGEQREPVKAIGSVGYALVKSRWQMWLLSGGGAQQQRVSSPIELRLNLNVGAHWSIHSQWNLLMDWQIYMTHLQSQARNYGQVRLGWQASEVDRFSIDWIRSSYAQEKPQISWIRYF